jgi:hypothetical protein
MNHLASSNESFYLIELFFMPFLGIAAALLANSVPIGGGIVYIPVLHLLGKVSRARFHGIYLLIGS